ncbi:VOC family protein [Rhodococcus chondri]|uniref:VOC family protein n=1 Tax=Rhodococcus chondri TaxID=3065941 RepID=A0ABU7JLV0_9NOCA|nr:VOC family protein [Rhodococcus sp. CC-R104]MEE2030697.1 VOC family protein [Rhodococcus sp. CC-R104]
MKADDLFHLGIVTDDLDATKDELSALLGYTWGPEVGGPIPVALPDGDRVVNLRCAYSITSPRLEVVAAVPDTFWQAGAGIHHLGYWSDDVDADCAELRDQGFTTEATRAAPDGKLFFAFARSSSGLLVELVTRAAQPGLEGCWAAPQ